VKKTDPSPGAGRSVAFLYLTDELPDERAPARRLEERDHRLGPDKFAVARDLFEL
jgi:hypothetical protein